METIEQSEWIKLMTLRTDKWSAMVNANPITYSFNFFCPDHEVFNHHDVNKEKLLHLIDTMIHLSNDDKEKILRKDHCHLIKNHQLKKYNVEFLLKCSAGESLHSFGEENLTVRLIGFFDKNTPYIFHVCLIDYFHKFYPGKSKKFKIPPISDNDLKYCSSQKFIPSN
jgi:hypothetical protein